MSRSTQAELSRAERAAAPVPPADATTRGPLFAPHRVAGLDLPNGFAMAPMTRQQAPAGTPDATVVEYYRRRAAGGVGLIVTEGILLDHPTAGDHPDLPRLSGPAAAAWSAVTDAVHATESKILAQLWHQGSERAPTDGVAAWTPSGVREDGSRIGHAVTESEIAALIGLHADAARHAESAGFDGVEVHAAHGYLLDEFLWPATNRRTDDYGGGPRKRARLLAEIVAAIRQVVGRRFVVGVRFSQFKERAFTARIAETPGELAALLEPVASPAPTCCTPPPDGSGNPPSTGRPAAWPVGRR